MPLTRDEILARKLGRETVQLPSGGEVVVRGLTRDETLGVKDLESVAEKDNYIIAAGLVDPVLSVDDVTEWAKEAAAGDLVAISQKISELSGMTATAGKESYKSPRRRSRT